MVGSIMLEYIVEETLYLHLSFIVYIAFDILIEYLLKVCEKYSGMIIHTMVQKQITQKGLRTCFPLGLCISM